MKNNSIFVKKIPNPYNFYNLGRKCNYYNVLSDHRNEYADHDFVWNKVEILHPASNKGKKEFMEMLYMKREGIYSINLKTDLVCTYSFERSLNDEKNFLQKQNFGYIWNQGASKIRLVTKNFEVFNTRGGKHPIMT